MSTSQSVPGAQATRMGYGDVVEEYRRPIVNGEWPPGQRIPTVRKTAAHLHVTMVTAQRAMQELQQQGFVESRGPRGSFVSDAWKTMAPPARAIGAGDAPVRPLCVGMTMPWADSTAPWAHPTQVVLERMLTALTCQAGGTFRRYKGEPAGRDAEALLAQVAEPPRPDALVIHSAFAAPSPADFIAQLRDNGTHCVGFSASLNERFPGDMVCLDDAWAFRTLVEELVARGHRRMAYVGVVAPDGAAQPWSETRREAVVEALQANGLGLEETYLLAPGDREASLANAEHWRGKERSAAVVCANDDAAITLMTRLRAWDVRVPQDVSVTGYDNMPAAGADADLTTFTMPEHRVAEAILSLAQRRVQGDAGLGDEVRIMVRPVLVPRGSWQRV